jgi:hypothetical protein
MKSGFFILLFITSISTKSIFLLTLETIPETVFKFEINLKNLKLFYKEYTIHTLGYSQGELILSWNNVQNITTFTQIEIEKFEVFKIITFLDKQELKELLDNPKQSPIEIYNQKCEFDEIKLIENYNLLKSEKVNIRIMQKRKR